MRAVEGLARRNDRVSCPRRDRGHDHGACRCHDRGGDPNPGRDGHDDDALLSRIVSETETESGSFAQIVSVDLSTCATTDNSPMALVTVTITITVAVPITVAFPIAIAAVLLHRSVGWLISLTRGHRCGR